MDFSAVPSSDELWSLSLPPPRFILLPGAASPTQHPGLRGRLVPWLSHEAPGAPRLALPPPPPPALRSHPRRWSRGGRQLGSTFAALTAEGKASLLSPARPACFCRDPQSPQEPPSASCEPRVVTPAPRPRHRVQNGARTDGRALPPARLRRGGRARVRRGASAEGGVGGWRGPRPSGSARHPARLGASSFWFRAECRLLSSL